MLAFIADVADGQYMAHSSSVIEALAR